VSPAPYRPVTPRAAADWLTSAEAGRLLRRSPKTIRNLVSLHKLNRKLIRAGRVRRWVMLLPPNTVEQLRVLCWGDLRSDLRQPKSGRRSIPVK